MRDFLHPIRLSAFLHNHEESKPCINTTLSPWSCWYFISRIADDTLGGEKTSQQEEGQGFNSLKNFVLKILLPPQKNKTKQYWTPFCLKKCLDVCLILHVCVEPSTVYISCSAWPWQVRNSWGGLLWGFWLKDQCLNKICVLITHLHIQSMSHWNSIAS